MPYISVHVTRALSDAQKDALKTALGEKISVIPGKSEAALMVDISDAHTIYMAGRRCEDTAYLDVKIYGTAEVQDQKAFTEAAFEAVSQATGIAKDAMYLTFSQFPNWGTRGTLK